MVASASSIRIRVFLGRSQEVEARNSTKRLAEEDAHGDDLKRRKAEKSNGDDTRGVNWKMPPDYAHAWYWQPNVLKALSKARKLIAGRRLKRGLKLDSIYSGMLTECQGMDAPYLVIDTRVLSRVAKVYVGVRWKHFIV